MEGEEGGADGECGGPFVLEDVEADGSGLGGDVGVPDFGVEFHFGGFVWVFWWELYVDLEAASFVWGVVGAFDVALPMSEISVEEGHFDC